MKMQDPALPQECWVSIMQRCSVTALYLFPSSLCRHYLISDHRQTRSLTESPSVHDPGGERRLLKFYVFAFDCCGYSSDALNASHLANLRQGQGVTVWSTAGQTGRDIWGRGTLVPVTPHRPNEGPQIWASWGTRVWLSTDKALKQKPSHPPLLLPIYCLNTPRAPKETSRKRAA